MSKPTKGRFGHVNREPFEWTSPDGVTITLPSAAMIPFGKIRRINSLPAEEQDGAMLEAVADGDTLAKIDELPLVDVLVLLTEWQEASGVTTGESAAS